MSNALLNGLWQGSPVPVTRRSARCSTSRQEVPAHPEVAGFDNGLRRVSEEVTAEQTPPGGEGAAERRPEERFRAEGPAVGKSSVHVRR